MSMNINEYVKKNQTAFLKSTGRARYLNLDDDALAAKMMDEIPTAVEKDQLINDWKINMELADPTKDGVVLKRCACCGITQLVSTEKKKTHKKKEYRWNYFLLSDLNVLRVEKAVLDGMGTDSFYFRNIYKPFPNENPDVAYFLIEELVQQKYGIEVCPECSTAVKCNKIPDHCVASGFDFGKNLKTLPPLNLMERLMISKSIIHLHSIKLKNDHAGSALLENCIVFPHNGIETCNTLPRLNLDELLNITYYGKRNLSALCMEKLRKMQTFQISRVNISIWLYFLKKHNSYYKNIDINEQFLTMGEDNFKAWMDSTFISIFDVEENENILRKDNEETGAPISNEKIESLDYYFMSSNYDLPTTEKNDVANSFLDDFQNALSKNQTFPIISEDTIPLNDYSHNDEILNGSFPTLFPLGINFPHKILNDKINRHLLLYYDQRFNNHEFIFFLFNQRQRANISRETVIYVNNSQEAFEDISNLLLNPNLESILKDAKETPESTEAKSLIKLLEKHLQKSGSRIPFSKHERKMSLSHLIGYCRHFGKPSYFITAAPSDLDSPLILKLAGLEEVTKIPIASRIQVAANSPVAVVETFFRTMNQMFEILLGKKTLTLGIPDEEYTRSTLPDPETRKKGIIGKCVAFYAVYEVQGRGTLHVHYLVWGGVPPSVLQYSAGKDIISDISATVLDAIVSCSLPAEIHKEYTVQLEQTGRSERFGMIDIPQNYVLFSQKIAAALNNHRKHTFSCLKGKYGYKRRHCPQTRPIQLIGIKNSTVTETVYINESKQNNKLFQDDDRLIIWELKREHIDYEKSSNETIVDFNEILTAAIKGNTNVIPITTTSTAKQIIFYLIKYMTKDPTKITAATALYYEAYLKQAKYKSIAEDSGTTSRTCKQFIQIILNSLTSSCEYSLSVCTALLLGYSSTSKSHGLVYCFVGSAVKHLEQQNTLLMNNSSDQTQFHTIDVNDTEEILYKDFDFTAEPFEIDDQPNTTVVPLEGFTGLFESDTPTPKTLQHIHYANRGRILKHLSLYEYSAMVLFKKKSPKKPTGRGRKPDPTFEFGTNHPWYDTHVQYFSAKFKVPMITGTSFPSYKPCFTTIKSANKWALYIAATFVPWGEFNSQLVSNYTDLIPFIQQMKDSRDIIYQIRYDLIKEISIGLQTNREHMLMCTLFRNQNADKWSSSINPNIFASQLQNENDDDKLLDIQNLLELKKLFISPSIEKYLEDSTKICNFLETLTYRQRNIISSIWPTDFDPLILYQNIKQLQSLPQPVLTTLNQSQIFKTHKIILNEEQQYVKDYILANLNDSNPLQLLIHGGPGVGKSTLVNSLLENIDHENYFCAAITGNAATLLINGQTIDSLFSLPIMTESSNLKAKLQAISHKELLSMQVKFEKCQLVVIDEISIVDYRKLFCIDFRLKQIKNPNLPFGGITIIALGDFFQLPPVGGNIWCDTIFDRKHTDIFETGLALIYLFKVIFLNIQQRAADDIKHTTIINSCRTNHNITASDIVQKYKILSKDTLKNDDEWNNCTFIVTSNQQRIHINRQRSKQFALKNGVPIIKWKKECIQQFSPKDLNTLYSDYQDSMEYFIQGAPVIIQDNINVKIGIANGTPATLHSLYTTNSLDKELIINAAPGEEVEISAPQSVNVILPKKFSNLPVKINSDAEFTIIPLISSTKKPTKIKIGKTSAKFKNMLFELGFALTFYKAQGQTIKRVAIDPRSNPFKQIDFASFYVSLTRVTNSDHVRFFSQSTKDLKHLEKLKPNPNIQRWTEKLVPLPSSERIFHFPPPFDGEPLNYIPTKRKRTNKDPENTTPLQPNPNPTLRPKTELNITTPLQPSKVPLTINLSNPTNQYPPRNNYTTNTLIIDLNNDDKLQNDLNTSKIYNMMNLSGNTILLTKYNFNIKPTDIITLFQHNWINDNIINFYIILIEKKFINPSRIMFNTFFYTKLTFAQNVSRWYRHIPNIFDLDCMIMPIHLHTHWAVININFKSKCVEYHDSIPSTGAIPLQIIKEFLHTEATQHNIELHDWRFVVTNDPKQDNGYDCGVFAIETMTSIATERPFTHSQQTIPHRRIQITKEILNGELF